MGKPVADRWPGQDCDSGRDEQANQAEDSGMRGGSGHKEAGEGNNDGLDEGGDDRVKNEMEFMGSESR